MRILYFSVLSLFFILWGIMYLPRVSANLFYYTDGLAFFLWLIPTVALYWLCFLPVVWLWKSIRKVGVVLSISCFLSAAYSPFLYEEYKFKSAAQIITQTDLSNTQAITPRTITIFNHTSFGERFFKERDLCGNECRSLLFTESVDWVKIVSFFEIKTTRQGVTFILKKGDDCRAHYYKLHDDKCIVISSNFGGLAELEIHRDYNGTNWGKEIIGHTFFPIEITADANNGRDLTRVYKQTDLSFPRILKPTIYYLGGDWLNASGVVLGRENLNFNKVSLVRTLRDLGYTIEKMPLRTAAHEMKNGPDLRMSRELMAVLDLSDAGFFSEGKSLPIINWVMAVNNLEKLESHHVEYIKRIIKETRLVTPSYIDRVFSKHKNIHAGLLPVILEVLEQNDYSSYKVISMPARSILNRLNQVKPALLIKYKSRILKLSEQYKDMRLIVGKLNANSLH